MTRDKMMDLLSLLNPASAAALSLAGITDEQLEFALFHEAQRIAAKRVQYNVAMDYLVNQQIADAINTQGD